MTYHMSLRVSKHSNQPCRVIFVNFYNFLNNDVIMSSLVSTGNCKLGHDCRRVCSETDDMTKLSPSSCEFVFTPPTPTRLSFVASASAVCIGLKWHAIWCSNVVPARGVQFSVSAECVQYGLAKGKRHLMSLTVSLVG